MADALADRIRALSGQLRTASAAPLSPALPRLVAPVDGPAMRTADGAAIAFVAAPDAPVRNPAPAVVAYAGDIAGLGGVVILKDADDLHLVLSGLGAVVVRPGQALAQGTMLGSMPAGAPRRLRLEARLGARPIDARPLFRPPLRLPHPGRRTSGRARQGMLRGAP